MNSGTDHTKATMPRLVSKLARRSKMWYGYTMLCHAKYTHPPRPPPSTEIGRVMRQGFYSGDDSTGCGLDN